MHRLVVWWDVVRGKSGPASGGTEYRLMPSCSVPADSASEIVKCTISIPRESCTNAKAKYSSSVVHFYHWMLYSAVESVRVCGEQRGPL